MAKGDAQLWYGFTDDVSDGEVSVVCYDRFEGNLGEVRARSLDHPDLYYMISNHLGTKQRLAAEAWEASNGRRDQE